MSSGASEQIQDVVPRLAHLSVTKRTSFVCALLLLLLGTGWPASASDQSADDEDELTDEFALLEDADIVESAARHRQEIGMSPSAITVITREQIETSGATSIPDLLRLVPGMDVIIVSPFFTAITSRLFWTYENNLYLVLVDGREANIELLGQAPWEIQPISLGDIERIEIIRGPGSSLYGANAVAGVVSITTKTMPEKTSVWAGITGGEQGTYSLAGKVSTRLGDWGLSINGGTDQAGEFSNFRATGKDVWKFRAVAEYRWSEEMRLLLDGGLSRGIGPVPSGTGTMFGEFDMRYFRLGYNSESLRGQLYWTSFSVDGGFTEPLEYAGIRLATFVPSIAQGHTLDGDVQWTLPDFWKPLLLIIGGGGRLSWLTSDTFLNAETFADLASPDFHKPGIDHFEARAGAFVHAELAPAEWVTITGGLRIDYHTEMDEVSEKTPVFLSPRFAAVFRPADKQFVRVSVARAFRKPSFLEKRAHPMVEFPSDSPITGPAQVLFQEFVSRLVGNSALDNEEIWAFEAGYRGQFFDDQLSVALDLYCNLYFNMSEMTSAIVEDSNRLPDLHESSYMYENTDQASRIIGSELAINYKLNDYISLLAAAAYRAEFLHETNQQLDISPKFLFTLGGRFLTDQGLLGSLYIFSRSKFKDDAVANPEGLLEDYVVQDMENVFLLMSRIGYRWKYESGIQLEIGANLFLPVSPFKAPYFRYYERGGGVTPDGFRYGGNQLSRVISVYLQGSY
ncbi:MAG: TonB-dependent receptor [Deltaproteobacteria bacterium]|nr:TonB-dependent receptor [Deltaproteobacteria bacterium]